MAAAAANKPGVNGDGWTEYRRLVLAELERLSKDLVYAQGQITTNHLTTSQAINSVKDTILDKLNTAIRESEIGHHKAIEDLEERYDKKIDELKEDLKKQGKDLDKTDKGVTSLKAQAVLLGGLAGFLVAVGGVIVSIIFKKD